MLEPTINMLQKTCTGYKGCSHKESCFFSPEREIRSVVTWAPKVHFDFVYVGYIDLKCASFEVGE